MSALFAGALSVLNVGIAGFADAIRQRGGAATQLDWAPPAAGDRAAGEALARLVNEPKIEAANAQAVERYLAAPFLDREALAIDRHKAAPWQPPAASGGTVWIGAADTSGLVVSYLQSLYWEFGSGVVLPRTGVLMQNRGASFSLDAGALNALEPGRLPFHTLNPALAVLADGRVIAYGTMGGDGQPQTQAAVFTRHVRYRMPLARAIEAPRWLLGRTWGAAHGNLRLEAGFEDALLERLRVAGHPVEVLPEPHSDLMGHAGAVVLHPDGTFEAGHDPRADGGAAGT